MAKKWHSKEARENERNHGKRILKYMEPYEVDPPEYFKIGNRRVVVLKECYSRSCNYVISIGISENCPKEVEEKIKLVHGTYAGYGCHFEKSQVGHAWVELPGEIVFDGVLQRFYNKEGYYKALNCIMEKEYSTMEAAINSSREHGHYGPWHKG